MVCGALAQHGSEGPGGGNMTKTIKITCKGQKYIPLNQLKAFQGNLKELHPKEFEKLKRSILKYGFSFPVFVWNNHILDGHQRIYVMAELIKEGYTIGDIPAVEIDAKNETEAAEKLLMINSRYAKITEDGLYEFLNTHSVDIESMFGDLQLPEIDINRFLTGYIVDDKETGGKEGKRFIDDELQYQILIKCENENHQFKLLDKFKKEGLKCQPLIL